jgi:hypothetical protein
VIPAAIPIPATWQWVLWTALAAAGLVLFSALLAAMLYLVEAVMVAVVAEKAIATLIFKMLSPLQQVVSSYAIAMKHPLIL